MLCPKCNKDKNNDQFAKSKRGRRWCKNCCREWYQNNKKTLSDKKKQYYLENKESISRRSKNYKASHKDDISKYCEKYYRDNREYILSVHSAYKVNNKDLLKKRHVDRMEQDPSYRLKIRLRNRIGCALRGKIKTGSAITLLGCSVNDLRTYLESKFQPGMTWENYGKYGWHIDHIRPLSSFDLSDPVQLKQACHYTNLQPLWAEDNLKKGNKYDKH